MTSRAEPSTSRLLTIADLQRLLRCGRTTAYARTREPGFPRPLASRPRRIGGGRTKSSTWLETSTLDESSSVNESEPSVGASPTRRPTRGFARSDSTTHPEATAREDRVTRCPAGGTLGNAVVPMTGRRHGCTPRDRVILTAPSGSSALLPRHLAGPGRTAAPDLGGEDLRPGVETGVGDRGRSGGRSDAEKRAALSRRNRLLAGPRRPTPRGGWGDSHRAQHGGLRPGLLLARPSARCGLLDLRRSSLPAVREPCSNRLRGTQHPEGVCVSGGRAQAGRLSAGQRKSSTCATSSGTVARPRSMPRSSRTSGELAEFVPAWKRPSTARCVRCGRPPRGRGRAGEGNGGAD